jgi:DNA-binding winged helix-turn-helix (wHTH) protein
VGFALLIEQPEKKRAKSALRAMADGVHKNLQFGPFELSSRERVLRRDGVVLSLGGRALDILIYLAERPGEVIAKQELIDHVWPDVTVEEGSIRVHVAAIRKALGDGQFGNRYIANIKGRGYSFVGTIVPLARGTESGNDRSRRRSRFPVRPTMMIGREAVISEVIDRLRDERFVTLLGPCGIGKTTVALAVGSAVAEEFGGEVHFVDLESLTDPRHVAGVVATSVGLALKHALEKLEEHAEVDVVFRRHAECVAGYLESPRAALLALSKTERDAVYPSQLGNIRAALEWSFGPNGDDEIATRLAAASRQLFLELSLLIECRVWAERAISRLGDRHKDSRREMEIYASLSLP